MSFKSADRRFFMFYRSANTILTSFFSPDGWTVFQLSLLLPFWMESISPKPSEMHLTTSSDCLLLLLYSHCPIDSFTVVLPRRILWGLETSINRFWGSEIVQGSVGWHAWSGNRIRIKGREKDAPRKSRPVSCLLLLLAPRPRWKSWPW